jgi:hypothetical protein
VQEAQPPDGVFPEISPFYTLGTYKEVQEAQPPAGGAGVSPENLPFLYAGHI